MELRSEDGRKEAIVAAPAWCGRDAGKHYFIKEWDAERADHWAIKALLAYNRGGADISMDVIGRGMEAIFFVGVQTFLRGQIKSEEVIPILDELLECVQIVRDRNAIDKMTGNPVVTPIASKEDIAEVKTRWFLRSEVLHLHTNFSPLELLGRLASSIMTPAPATSGNT